jgi:hypothetical protein
VTVISARLNTHPVHGAVVRLSNYGQTFASMPVPVQRGEEPTEAAERALAEHDWTLAQSMWESTIGGGTAWTAEVDTTEKSTSET